MPIQYLSGTPYPRVSDPPQNPGLPDARGLYPWSVFEARLVTLVGGNVTTVTTIDQGDTVSLLLFACDVPAICKYVSVKGGSSPFFGDVNNSLTSSIVSETSGGPGGYTISNYGEVAKCYAGAGNLVYAPGFLASAAIVLNGGSGTASSVDIQCWANGGANISPIGPNNHAGSTLAPQPIILHFQSYTPEIQAAGNLVTDATGGKIWRVVGLHNANLV